MGKSKNFISLLIFSLYLASCNHQTDKNQEGKEEKAYLIAGKEIALKTKKILGSNLIKALGESGPENAISFCNTHAATLTDSSSKLMNAFIKRVSDKVRNPKNVANKTEIDFILRTKELMLKGEELKPQIQEINGKMVAYYPIKTNGMCLQCHGNKSSAINTETLSKINKLYPNDKATGYKDNELRGIWVVEMEK